MNVILSESPTYPCKLSFAEVIASINIYSVLALEEYFIGLGTFQLDLGNHPKE